MADPRLDAAREAGRGPRAPAWTAWWICLGGLTGALIGAAATPWRRLTQASFGLDAQALPDLSTLLAPSLLGAAGGALAGLALGQLTLDRPTLRLRWRARPSSAGRRLGLLALAAGGAVALAAPALLPALAANDPGRALWLTPVAVLGAMLLAGLPLAAWDRTRGRARWREKEAPWPPPRKADDAMPPEVRAALAAAGQPGPLVMDRVVTDGIYAAAVLDDPPRLVAHGGAHLIALAQEADIPVVHDPARAARLAAIPTGEAITR